MTNYTNKTEILEDMCNKNRKIHVPSLMFCSKIVPSLMPHKLTIYIIRASAKASTRHFPPPK